MRKTVLAVMVILVFLAVAFLVGVNPALEGAVVEDSWTAIISLPSSSYDVLGAAVVDGKIYFLGNEICERYDPEANIWTVMAPPPIYLSGAVVACQNKIYVIGDPTQVYDPSTDTWANRTSIPVALSGQKANVVADKIFVIGGQKPSVISIVNPSDANYVYDPATDSWSSMASIPTPVVGHASAVLDNKIYIIGGGTTTNIPKNATNLVQIFDPETNQWTTGKPIPTGVYGAGACSTSGLMAPKRIYVVGGSLLYDGGGLMSGSSSGGTATNINQVYDPKTGEWSLAASLPESRWSFSLVNANDALYAVGGFNGSYYIISVSIQATEKYIPVGYDESLLPTPSPSTSPTASPTPAPDGYAANLPIILSVVAVIVAITIAELVVYYKKSKKKLKVTNHN